MQRFVAILVLCLTGFLPATSAAAANTTTQLPACCRTAGRHKCVMHMAHGSTANPVVYSTCGKCSLWQPVSSAAVDPSLFLPTTSQIVFAEIASHPVVHPQTEARRRISFARSGQKRGPPDLLS